MTGQRGVIPALTRRLYDGPLSPRCVFNVFSVHPHVTWPHITI